VISKWLEVEEMTALDWALVGAALVAFVVIVALLSTMVAL